MHPGGVNPQQGMGIIPTFFGIHQGEDLPLLMKHHMETLHWGPCCTRQVKAMSAGVRRRPTWLCLCRARRNIRTPHGRATTPGELLTSCSSAMF